MKLISYKYKLTRTFGHGEYETIYQLTFQKSWFFGLVKKLVKMDYKVSMFSSIKDHETHWNDLIVRGCHVLNP